MSGCAAPSRVAVLGLGNILLGDDGVGCLTVEMFRHAWDCDPAVEIADLGTPGLDLTPYLYGRDLVLIVDAVNAEGDPGTVHLFCENDFLSPQAPLRLTDHDSGFQESLAQLRLVDRAPAELIVIGIIPESCAYGDAISATGLLASAMSVDVIARILREHGFDCRERSGMVPVMWGARFALGGYGYDYENLRGKGCGELVHG